MYNPFYNPIQQFVPDPNKQTTPAQTPNNSLLDSTKQILGLGSNTVDNAKNTANEIINSAAKADITANFNAGIAQEQQRLQQFKTQYKERFKNLKKLVFPGELASLNRPIIEFKCLQSHSIIENGTSIYLPAPEGLAYSNSSTYNDSELGIIGNAMLGGLNIAKNSSSAEEAINTLSAAGGAAWQNASTGFKTDPKSAILAAISAGLGNPTEGAKAAVGIAAGARFNPYVVTAFDGTNTRNYNFEYKFIPSSKSEAETIKNIANIFQICVYGEVEGFLLKYPPKWSISILSAVSDGNGGLELKPLSSFYECYLEGCDITYNSSNNSYFYDDSPLETDITIRFKETKALHANEIAQLLVNR